MKSTVTAVLVALLFVSGIAFAQGMRVEKKKVVKDAEKAPSTVLLEEDVEIFLELEKPACPGCKESKDGPCEKCKAAKKTIGRRVIVRRGEPGEMKGKIVVARPGEEAVAIEQEELDNLRAVIKDLEKARVNVHSSRKAIEDTRHVMVRRMVGGAHGAPMPPRCGCGACNAPKPAPHCQNCAPRPPACPHCAPRHGGGHMGSMDPMGGLRQSLDALRGEIAGLRHEIRAIRGAHAPKAPTVFHMSGLKAGSFGVAVKRPPVKKPAPPPKSAAVWKSAGAYVVGGAGARAPVKPDPRQAKLEKEVQNLRKETAHMKQMMAEILKKLDGMQMDK